MSFLFVFLGGGVGATLRFLSSLFFSQWSLAPHWSTLLVNTLGSLFFVFTVKWGKSDLISDSFFRVGLLGALTTFSTFSFEAISAIQRFQYGTFFAILGLNLLFGIGLGLILFRMN